jgi:hypothetical protein
MAAASRKILLPFPPRKNKQLTETIPATDNTQISIANITKLQLDIRQHEQKISEMKDNLILLLQEHLMSKLTHRSQPRAASYPLHLTRSRPHRHRNSMHFRRLVTFRNR